MGSTVVTFARVVDAVESTLGEEALALAIVQVKTGITDGGKHAHDHLTPWFDLYDERGGGKPLSDGTRENLNLPEVPRRPFASSGNDSGVLAVA